jgi:hypothetical protein
VSEDDEFDPSAYRLPDVVDIPEARVEPRSRQRRREYWVKFPWEWAERLKSIDPLLYIAVLLLHQDQGSKGRPVQLANKALEYDGISRKVKSRVLRQLEGAGLIQPERQPRKSPLIRVLRDSPLPIPTRLVR